MAERHVGSGQQYATIQAGVNAANAGDQVIVHDGTYAGTVNIPSTKTGITIVAYSGDAPVLTGLADSSAEYQVTYPNNAYPRTGPWKYVSVPYAGTTPPIGWYPKSFKYTSLVLNEADDVTWKGIKVERSAGRGITSTGNNMSIEDTEVYMCRGSAIVMWFADNSSIKRCEIHKCVYYYYGFNIADGGNHPGVVLYAGSHNQLIEDTIFHENAGETVCIDANRYGSSDIIVRRCKFSDSKRSLFYIHATRNVDIDSCVFYHTVDQDCAEDPNPPTMVPIEQWSCDNSNADTIKGVENVTLTNCLFVNCHFIFGDSIADCSPFARNVDILGCSFVITDGRQVFTAWGNSNWENVLIDGCLFYLKNSDMRDNSIIAGHTSTAGNWTWSNNIWNKSLTTPASVVAGTGDIYNVDLKLANPDVVVTVDGFSEDNYRLESDSPAINTWSNPTANDYFGGTRDAVSDRGFHDYAASGGGTVTPSPIADFDMHIGAQQVVGDIELNSTVDFTDTSVPVPTKTITGWFWNISIPGTTYTYTYTTQNISHAFNEVGKFTVYLRVTQDDGEMASTSQLLNVVEEVIDPPPPPPTVCQWVGWKSYVRSGVPEFGVGDPALNERLINCVSGAQGSWISDWGGNVTADQDITVTVYVKTDISQGNGTLVALYYGTSGLISSESVNIVDNGLVYTQLQLNGHTPVGTTKIRTDVRLWNGTGTISFKEPCITSATQLDPPQAEIDALLDDTDVITNGQNLELGSHIYFYGNNSVGDGLSYNWQIYKSVDGYAVEFGDPITTTNFDYVFSSIGTYSVGLAVTQSDDQTSVDAFGISIGEVIEVYFSKYQQGVKIGSYNIITGNPPITVRFVPVINTNIEVLSIGWQILDVDRNIVQEFVQSTDIMLTFPLDLDLPVYEYGMRMVVTFTTGLVKHYEENSIIRLTEVSTNVIGPSTPLSLNVASQSNINSDGSHSHLVEAMTDGSANSIVRTDAEGAIKSQKLLVGLNSTSLPTGLPAVIHKGITFVDELGSVSDGIIEAQVLNIAGKFFIVADVPDYDPGIKNCLWNDGGTAKFSTGVDTGGGGGEPSEFNAQISASANDAQEHLDDTVYLANGLMVTQPTYYPWMALRFPNVTIPAGATITNAYINGKVHANGQTSICDIGVELIANSPAIVASDNNISSRTQTTNKVQNREGWLPTGWHQFSLPIAGLQEVIDLPGWASGNAITVIFEGVTDGNSCNLAIIAYDYSPTSCAQIYISYTT